MNFSLLELGHAGATDGPGSVVESVLAAARWADGAGLRRIWFPEHHNPDVMAPAPDLLCAHVAPIVSKVRLGAAGVLLRLHSPWAVAERWALLSHLVPNGVDLGIARGDVDPPRAAALRDGPIAESASGFEGRVATLLSHLSGAIGPPLSPRPAPGLEVWLHGRQHLSADVAKRFGLRYCHSRFLGPPTEIPPGADAVAFAGVCAPSDEEAREWASPGLGPFRATLIAGHRRWERALAGLQRQGGVSEFVFVDLCGKPDHHLRSITLLGAVVRSVPSPPNAPSADFG